MVTEKQTELEHWKTCAHEDGRTPPPPPPPPAGSKGKDESGNEEAGTEGEEPAEGETLELGSDLLSIEGATLQSLLEAKTKREMLMQRQDRAITQLQQEREDLLFKVKNLEATARTLATAQDSHDDEKRGKDQVSCVNTGRDADSAPPLYWRQHEPPPLRFTAPPDN